MDNVVVLKKYANRRIYDTEKSTYVTLAQVADYIRSGRQVRIHDAKTKEDVTSFILTQIILEEAKNKNALLPVHMLHMIIRYGDNLLGEFFEKYFNLAFQNFVAHKNAMDNHFKQWLEMGRNLSKMTSEQFTESNPFQPFFDPFSGYKKKKPDED